MIVQSYVKLCNCTQMFVEHIPIGNKGSVILFSGFLESCADRGYFMSNLANTLEHNGYFVWQIDPYAHGDSYGNTVSITYEKYRRSIFDAIDYVSHRYGSEVIVITRGIAGNVVLERSYKQIAINPLCLTETTKKLLIKKCDEMQRDECVSLRDMRSQVLEEEANFESILGAMKNNVDMCMPVSFIKEVVTKDLDCGNIMNQNKCVIFPSLDDKGDLVLHEFPQKKAYESFGNDARLQCLLEQYMVNKIVSSFNTRE